MRSMPHWLPYAILTVSGLLFFGELVVHPTQVLYSDTSDFFAEHVPAKIFVVQSWHDTGELPLWCPYLFSGEPIVADLQVAMFYPLHMLFLFLPESWLAPGLSWLIVLHVMAAGWFMFAYARSQQMGEMGALVAAWGYMFSAKWMLHMLTAGHYITLGMTWIPLTLLFLDMAVRKRCLLAATGAGCSFALLILCTHPQWILYGGVLIALWSLGPIVESGDINWAKNKWPLLRILGYGVWAVAIAVALSAIQLLPTLETSRYTSRSAGMAVSDSIDGGARALLNLIGPAAVYRPDTINSVWEDRAGLGLWWLAAAVCAWWLTSRKLVRYQVGVGLGLLLFALGGSLLFEFVPGFKVFRQPSRMLVIVAFPVAYLAGITADAFWGGITTETRDRCRFIVSRVCALCLLGRAGDVALHYFGPMRGETLHFHPYWPSLVVTGAAVWWLFSAQPSRLWRWVWIGVLLMDLLAFSLPQVAVRPFESIYPPSATLEFLNSHREPRGRVLDFDRDFANLAWGTPLGPGAPLAPIHHIEAVRGFNPLDVLRYKEYLQLLSGRDRALRGLSGVLMNPVIANFAIEYTKFLDLLNVRYILCPNDESFTIRNEDMLPLRPMSSVVADAFTLNMLASPGAPGPFLAATSVLGREGAFLSTTAWVPVFIDPAPVAYNFLHDGVQTTAPYVIYENRHAFPRAFVVPEAATLPERDATAPEKSQVLPVMLATDFRRTVLLEGGTPRTSMGGDFHAVRIKQYLPNRVTLDLAGTSGGYLVLADIWYPGWNCTIDGQPATIQRGNFLFRAVEIPSGAREATFTYEPVSYLWGKRITWTALAAVLTIVLILSLLRTLRPGGDVSHKAPCNSPLPLPK